MTLPSYDNRRSYTGNGSTTAFAFPPPFTANTDLVVQIQAASGAVATKVLGVDYTVSGAGMPSGGSVTMTVAPAAGSTLIIYRDVPITQSVDLQDGGPLPATTINRALDRITMWGQRLREQVIGLGTPASQTAAGLMSAADKVKLDGVEPGAQVNAVTSVAGRTGAINLAKGDVGLANVDNTSDIVKPVSAAQQAALDAKASRASNLSDLTNAAAARINLGGGVTGISVFQAANSSTALTAIGATATGSSLATAANTSAVRTILGLVPGTDIQAYSAHLAEIAGISWAQGDVLYFNGASLARLPAGTAGQFFRTGGPSGTPSWASIAGGGDMLRANNLSDVVDPTTARLNLGAVGTSSPTVADTLTISGAATQTINLNSAGNAFQLAVQTNGTANISAYTANRPINYAVANGGSHVFYVDDAAYFTADATGVDIPTGATYKINGTGLTFSDLGGSAAANQGGTGQTSYAVGDLLYASGTTTLSKLTDVATGSALISGGVGAAPSWGKIGLTTHISGTLAVANGGTNITTYATGDILYASAANTLSKLARGTNGQVLTLTGGVPSWTTVSAVSVPVRQTVLSGPASSGLPSFLPATAGSLSITSQNISTGANALVATAANGFGATGAANVIGVATSNLTWSALSASTTNYLFVTINSGTLTTGSTTLQPFYQYGGMIATTNGQYTFDIVGMQMYLGNGSVANPVNAVFIGEVVTDASGVTSTIAYAYSGYYTYTDNAAWPAAGVKVIKQSNLGFDIGVTTQLEAVCVSADLNYSPGDVLQFVFGGTTSSYHYPPIPTKYTRNTVAFVTPNNVPLGGLDWNTGYGISGFTASRWRYRLTAQRRW